MNKLLIIAAVFASVSLHAQSKPVLRVTFEREGVPVPYWRFVLDSNGVGTFEQHPVNDGRVTRPIRLSQSTWGRMQSLLADSHNLTPCETKTKGLARIGNKTVDWTTPEGIATRCTFNYTDNKSLTALADLWNALASTLDEARRIGHLHKHDRLGLDKELAEYEHAVEQGFAADPTLIAPELQSLVDDNALMDRVRRRAQHLLEDSHR